MKGYYRLAVYALHRGKMALMLPMLINIQQSLVLVQRLFLPFYPY